MQNYYINTIPNADQDQEVHTSSCVFRAHIEHRQHLGSFSSYKEALEYARMNYVHITGCEYCCVVKPVYINKDYPLTSSL